MNDSFVFYLSFHEALAELSDEQYGRMMRIINEYALYGTVPEGLGTIEKMVFTLIQPQIDANNKRKTNGGAGGRPPKTNGSENEKPMVSESKTNGFENENHRFSEKKPNVNVNANANVNANENENSKEKPNADALGKKNPRPTLDEVKAYAGEKGRPEEAEHFFDFYTANGWKVGKNPMKDWQAAFRNWLKNDFDRGKPKVSEADFYASIAEAERTGFGRL